MSDLGNKEIIAKNIEFYMNLYKKSRMDMCRLLDVSYSTFADWVNAKKYPRIDKIEMMAHIFNVKKSDLVEKPTEKKNKFLVLVSLWYAINITHYLPLFNFSKSA